MPQPIEQASIEEAGRGIVTVRRLLQQGLSGPALLAGWAVIEALGRLLWPRLAWAQSTDNLIEALAFEGNLTPAEADLARALARSRNRLAHGDLKVAIAAADLDAFVLVLDELLSQVRARDNPAK